ncbi:MAG: SDR family NAD(P)-dependent oxidoreductase [Proteobacteria bacterium]|nr:SDR family NAD(P)-dependent oxidoreductase [Pseudomonadota bacterium]
MKIAVVTGGGRGLGSCIAGELAARGYSVLVTDIDEVAAADTARHIGSDAWSMHQDVRDPESHRRVAFEASERGDLSVWINNAGVLEAGTTWEMPEEMIRRQVEVNVLGLIWGSHAAVAAMQRGHIVNIASISGLVPAPGLAVYGATKHAVLGFSVALQGELDRAGRPIQVSSICPDAIETDMVNDVSHLEEAAILFSAKALLSPQSIAASAVALLDRPRLVAVYPRYRGLLAHLFRPFPRLGLKVLDQFHKLGDRRRKHRL